jgi:uncharacterized protein (TIGR00156 family)
MLKNIKILIVVMSLCIANTSFAKDRCECGANAGGFLASENDITSVKNAQSMADDSIVTLQGKIEKRIKKDKYQFSDASGNMIVKIGKKVWHGQVVNSTEVVQITGEIDKDHDGTILDVESLIKK